MYKSEKELKKFFRGSGVKVHRLPCGLPDFLAVKDNCIAFVEAKRYVYHNNFYVSMLTKAQKEWASQNITYVFFIGKSGVKWYILLPNHEVLSPSFEVEECLEPFNI